MELHRSDSYTVTPIKYLTNSTGKVRSGAVGAKAGKCFHEDGGSNAVFEPLEYVSSLNSTLPFLNLVYKYLLLQTDEVQLICGDKIVMGPTYKVVSCDCAKNKALKTFDEWCEYCRCEQCGGKNIVFGSNGRPATGPEFTLHIDLVLWVLLLLLVYYLLVKHDHQIYKTLLCTGILSAVFYVRGFFSKSELTFKP